MKFIGFNFSKISIDKKKGDFKNLKINANVDLLDVVLPKADFSVSKNEQLLQVRFNHTIDYQPDIAKIELEGTVLLSVDQKTADEFQKEWKKKRLPKNHNVSIFNIILRKSTIKALELEEETNLPLHTKSLPVVKQNE